jgi:hypothetical protein
MRPPARLDQGLGAEAIKKELNMSETEDLTIVLQAVDEAQRLLRAHVELSADAATTVERLDELLFGQSVIEALERVRLRSLRGSLIAPAAPLTRT